MLNVRNIKRQYLLVAAALVLTAGCYELAFKKTITAWQINRQLKSQLARSFDVSFQPEYNRRKNANLDRLLNLYKADTINFRSSIIGKISSIAEKENVKLSDVPSPDSFYRTQRFLIQKLSFEGDYFGLIKVLDDLHNTSGIGVLRSASLRSMNNINAPKNDQKIKMEVCLEISLR
jgi:hypothetical protein